MIENILILLCIGMLAGILGGLLGIGGSVIIIPALVWSWGKSDSSGREMLLQYQAAAMIVNFFMACVAARKHYKIGAVYLEIYKVFLPMAVIGVVIGVLIARLSVLNSFGQLYLRYAFGFFMIYVAIVNILKILRPAAADGLDEKDVTAMPRWRKYLVAISMGFASGLFGIGGGAIAVPMMHNLLKMPLRNSIATSSMIIVVTSLIGALLKNATLGLEGSFVKSVTLAAFLIPTAMLGGYAGSHLTHKLPLVLVRSTFVIIMFIASYKMLS